MSRTKLYTEIILFAQVQRVEMFTDFRRLALDLVSVHVSVQVVVDAVQSWRVVAINLKNDEEKRLRFWTEMTKIETFIPQATL